jgi:hypothetical protein
MFATRAADLRTTAYSISLAGGDVVGDKLVRLTNVEDDLADRRGLPLERKLQYIGLFQEIDDRRSEHDARRHVMLIRFVPIATYSFSSSRQ